MRLIDQQKAIEAMSSVAVLDKSAARRILTQLPTIEATPVKHGRWIQADLYKNCIVCSVCKNRGYKDKMAWRPDYAKRYFNFCPNCGASMMEGAES